MSRCAEAMSGLDHLMTDAEHRIVRDLGGIWNDFCSNIPEGPARSADLAEAAFHVHALQRMVMSQAAARAFPDRYRELGKVVGG